MVLSKDNFGIVQLFQVCKNRTTNRNLYLDLVCSNTKIWYSMAKIIYLL